MVSGGWVAQAYFLQAHRSDILETGFFTLFYGFTVEGLVFGSFEACSVSNIVCQSIRIVLKMISFRKRLEMIGRLA